jgi:hypothetical protein
MQMVQDTQAMVADLSIAVASLREEVARGAAVSFPLPWMGAPADGLPPLPLFPEFPPASSTTVGRVDGGGSSASAGAGAEESKVTDGGVVITTPDDHHPVAPPPPTPEPAGARDLGTQAEASVEPAAPALAPPSSALVHGRRGDKKHHGHGPGTPRQLQLQQHSPVVTGPSGPLVDAEGFEIRELPVTVPVGVRVATEGAIADLYALGSAALARRSVADITSALAYFGHPYKPPKDSAAQLLHDLLHGTDGRAAQAPLLPPASPVLTPVTPVE